MRSAGVASAIAIVVAGIVVTASLVAFTHTPAEPATQATASLTIWQAYARGLVTIAMVNLTFQRGGTTVTEPAGIRVTNTANESVVVPEEAVLMSPHPGQSPAPDPLNTTQDAALTNATVAAGSSLTYSYGLYVLQGFLSGPTWWCLEEMQFSKAGVLFALGGETLPYALRALVEHPYFVSADHNSQTDIWSYFRHDASVVVEKLPLESHVNASGDTIRVRLDATNLAVWSTDDNVTANVNVTGGVVEDDILPGWTVQAGSYSTPPSEIVNHSDGSQTLRWVVDLPAAQVSEMGNPEYPTPYSTVTRSYTLVSPSLNGSFVDLPRARSDLNDSGTIDAHSAPVGAIVVGGSSPPPAQITQARIGLRVAGERGGELNLSVHGNGTALATLSLEREPGEPGTAWTPLLTFNLSQPVNVTVVYTPGRHSCHDGVDDHGDHEAARGDNPAWISIKFPDGTEVVFFHNFNAEHPSTWTWDSGDLRPVFRALNETRSASSASLALHLSGSTIQTSEWLAASSPRVADARSSAAVKLSEQRVI